MRPAIRAPCPGIKPIFQIIKSQNRASFGSPKVDDYFSFFRGNILTTRPPPPPFDVHLTFRAEIRNRSGQRPALNYSSLRFHDSDQKWLCDASSLVLFETLPVPRAGTARTWVVSARGHQRVGYSRHVPQPDHDHDERTAERAHAAVYMPSNGPAMRTGVGPRAITRRHQVSWPTGS